jgi:hypothetical protein
MRFSAVLHQITAPLSIIRCFLLLHNQCFHIHVCCPRLSNANTVPILFQFTYDYY